MLWSAVLATYKVHQMKIFCKGLILKENYIHSTLGPLCQRSARGAEECGNLIVCTQTIHGMIYSEAPDQCVYLFFKPDLDELYPGLSASNNIHLRPSPSHVHPSWQECVCRPHIWESNRETRFTGNLYSSLPCLI